MTAPDDSSPEIQGRGKRPVTKLAGPYGHPFHPVLVTIPIGAFVASLVFDLGSFFAGEAEVFAKGAFWLIGVGLVGAVLAAVFGFMDLLAIPRHGRAFRTGLLHLALNGGVVVLFLVGFLLRQGELDDGEVGALSFLISLVALGLLTGSGWLGGKLAYRYGVRVADEATQADGFR